MGKSKATPGGALLLALTTALGLYCVRGVDRMHAAHAREQLQELVDAGDMPAALLDRAVAAIMKSAAHCRRGSRAAGWRCGVELTIDIATWQRYCLDAVQALRLGRDASVASVECTPLADVPLTIDVV